jgi:hypothetical protein
VPKDARVRVAEMDWNEFEAALRAPVRGATGGDAQAVQQVFDEQELEELRALAASSARQRTRAPLAGNVIYVPGIMGSSLATRHLAGDEDLIWINFFRIATGLLMRLKLAPDGTTEADGEFSVKGRLSLIGSSSLVKGASRHHGIEVASDRSGSVGQRGRRVDAVKLFESTGNAAYKPTSFEHSASFLSVKMAELFGAAR